MRAWFVVNTVAILSSLAAPWTESLFGYGVVFFAVFTIRALPGLLTGRVLPDVVTLSDVWLGLSVASGWLATISYLALIGGARVQRRFMRAIISMLPLAIGTASLSTFATRQGSVDELTWGFWLLCVGLVSSVALEVTAFLTSRVNAP